MSSCLLCVWSPCFFSYISGVKRGVCSQINHFPEDADFDHDGAEYVLRKSIPALLGMDDKWERGLVVNKKKCKTWHFFIAPFLKRFVVQVTMCVENQGRWGALVHIQCPAVISFCSLLHVCPCIHKEKPVFCLQCCRGILLAFRWHFSHVA